jgi:hypothetical protein
VAGILRGGQHAIDSAKSKGIERAIPAELAVVLLQEPEQPPGVVAEHGEEAGQGREELPPFQDLPRWITNAALSCFEAENFMPLPLQPDALLGHSEQIGDGGGVQHFRVGQQCLLHFRTARACRGQCLGQGIGAAAEGPCPARSPPGRRARRPPLRPLRLPG